MPCSSPMVLSALASRTVRSFNCTSNASFSPSKSSQRLHVHCFKHGKPAAYSIQILAALMQVAAQVHTQYCQGLPKDVSDLVSGVYRLQLSILSEVLSGCLQQNGLCLPTCKRLLQEQPTRGLQAAAQQDLFGPAWCGSPSSLL